MGVFRAIYRYIATLGGLIESDIDGQTDKMLTTPSGIKATFQKTRDDWGSQYTEVRESVAQLMVVLDKKSKKLESLTKEGEEVKIKMKGAVERFKSEKDPKFQEAFTELFNRDKQIAAEEEALQAEVKELQQKVDSYKEKLKDMQKRISELDQRESEAIADIVSSQQIISLNDRLNNISTQLDDRNLRAVEQRRESLIAQAKLSSELSEVETVVDIGDDLLNAGMQSEAADVFAAMLAESEKKEPGSEAAETTEESRGRDI